MDCLPIRIRAGANHDCLFSSRYAVGKRKMGEIKVTLEEYLQCNKMKLSTFAKTYNLDYHGLFRVKQGAVTRDEAIKRVFEQLNIINDGKQKVGEPNTSFLSQECVCIHCAPSGDIYCYYRHHLQEIEEYLLQQNIPYYVRQAKDYWLVKYDKEADR